MPLNAMYDMNGCMHFTDDWMEDDDEEWDDIYPDPRVESPETTKH